MEDLRYSASVIHGFYVASETASLLDVADNACHYLYITSRFSFFLDQETGHQWLQTLFLWLLLLSDFQSILKLFDFTTDRR